MGQNRIGAIIALDGEREFKSAVTSCNNELKNLASQSDHVKEKYAGQANTIEALRAKQEVLTRTIEAQNRKVSETQRGLEHAKESYNRIGAGLETLRGKYETAKRKMEEMERSTDTTTEEMKRQKEEVKKLSEAIQRGEQNYERAGNRVQRWEADLNRANTQVIRTNREINQNARYLREAEQSADQCASSIDRFGREIRQAGDNADDAGEATRDSINTMTSALAAAGIAKGAKEIAEALYSCVEAAEAFETSTAKLSTIADETKVPMETLSSDILKLSNDTGMAAASLTESTYQAISAGTDTADAVSLVDQANKLAIGGFTDTETSIDVLTTAINAYGLEMKDVDSIGNMLVTTQNLGKTSVGELASSVGKVIPLASAYGVKMDNLSSAYTVLTANGIKTAEATTYIKSILNELGKEGSKVSDTLKEQTGKSFAQLMESGSSLGDVLQILGDSCNGDTTAFANLWSSTEAGVGALSVFNSGADEFNRVLGEMQNSAGATEEAYGKMTDTAEFSKQKMTNSMENLKIAIGQQLSPALNELYKAGSLAFEWATEYINQNPWLVSALAGLTAALGTLAVGIAGVMVAKKATEIMKLFNKALKENPAIFIATAIIGLTTAISAYIAKTEKAAADQEKLAQAGSHLKKETDELTDATKESGKSFLETAVEIQKQKGEVKQLCDETARLTEQTLQNQEARKKDIESIEAEYGACQKMSDELFALAEKENLTNDEKSRMQILVDQLNTSMPELNLQFDRQKGILNQTKDAVNGSIESMKNYILLQALTEQSTEVLKEQFEASMNLKKAEKEREKVLEELEKKQGIFTEKQKEAAKAAAENGQAIMTTGYAYTQMDKETISLQSRLSELNETIEENKAVVDSTEEECNIMAEAMVGLKTETEGAKKETGEFAEAAQQGAEQTAAATGEISEAYEKMKEGIADSVEDAISLLDEFNGGTEITGEEILKNLNSQVDGTRHWADNMSLLAQQGGRGMTQEFYNYIAELGPQSANMVQALVDSLNGEAGQFETICQTWMDGVDLKEPITNVVMDGSEAFDTGMEEITEKVILGSAKVNAEMEKIGQGDIFKALTDAFSKAKKDTETAGGEITGAAQQAFSEAVEKAKLYGVQIPQELVNGIAGGTVSVEKATVDIRGLISAELAKVPPEAQGKGQEASGAYGSGIKENKGAVTSATADVAVNATATGWGYAKDFYNVGQHLVKGLAEGIVQGSAIAQGAAANIIRDSIDAAKREGRIHSPSRAFRDEVGIMLPLGLAAGIKDGTVTAQRSAADMCKKILEASEKEISNPRKNLSKAMVNSVKNEIDGQIGNIGKDTKKIAKATNKLNEDQTKQAYEYAKKQIEATRKKIKVSMQDEKEYWSSVKNMLKKGTKEYETAAKRIRDLDFSIKVSNKGNFGVDKKDENGKAKSASKYSGEVLEAATSWLSSYKNQHDLTIENEVNFWSQIRKQLKKGTAAYNEATQNIKAAKKSAAQEKLSASDKALTQYKTYYQASAKAEVQYWDIVRKQFKTGTDERIEADQKYYEAKENLNSQLESLNQEYVQNCSDVQDQLKTDIKDLTAAYNDAVKERADSIYSSFGLFDSFYSESESGEQLLKNLKSQVAGIADWELEVQNLAGRGLPTDLMDELKAMGPEASASMHALNSLTNDQLKEYAKLWQQKHDLSTSQAVQELEPMRKETETQIKKLTATAKTELANLKKEYNAAVKELNTGISTALKKVANSTKKIGEDATAQLIAGIKSGAKKKSTAADLKSATTTVEKGLSTLPAAGKTIGKNTLEGILGGLNNKKVITKSAKSFVEELKTAIKKAADIHSPSRLFKDEIGVQISAGVGEGIEEGAPRAKKAGTAMISEMLESYQNDMKSQQQRLADCMGQINSSAGLAALNNLIATPAAPANVTIDNAGLLNAVNQMCGMLSEYLPQLGNMQMVTDTGALIGETKNGLSAEFAMMGRRMRK